MNNSGCWGFRFVTELTRFRRTSHCTGGRHLLQCLILNTRTPNLNPTSSITSGGSTYVYLLSMKPQLASARIQLDGKSQSVQNYRQTPSQYFAGIQRIMQDVWVSRDSTKMLDQQLEVSHYETRHCHDICATTNIYSLNIEPEQNALCLTHAIEGSVVLSKLQLWARTYCSRSYLPLP
ncbi:hypothetical protein K440DRAFT_164881 [Wilcoxina mikolae CBS 423.85]|nr:hypothetical protein K440DRAFT_164881 [Wilcoxina mikolae CBS 423.85]